MSLTVRPSTVAPTRVASSSSEQTSTSSSTTSSSSRVHALMAAATTSSSASSSQTSLAGAAAATERSQPSQQVKRQELKRPAGEEGLDIRAPKRRRIDWTDKLKEQLQNREVTKLRSQTINTIISFIKAEQQAGRWPAEGSSRVYPAASNLPRTLIALGSERVIVVLNSKIGEGYTKFILKGVDSAREKPIALLTFSKKYISKKAKDLEIAINLQFKKSQGLVETYEKVTILPPAPRSSAGEQKVADEDRPLCYKCDLHPCNTPAEHEIYADALVQPIYSGELENAMNDRDEETPISIDEKIAILKDLIIGLATLHAAGIAHNDLLACNAFSKRDSDEMLIGSNIADFGKASKNKPADMSGDVQDLGIILYRLFTGQKFFLEEDWERTGAAEVATIDIEQIKKDLLNPQSTGHQTALQQYNREIAVLDAIEEVDTEINTLIKGMLHFDPAQRITMAKALEILPRLNVLLAPPESEE